MRFYLLIDDCKKANKLDEYLNSQKLEFTVINHINEIDTDLNIIFIDQNFLKNVKQLPNSVFILLDSEKTEYEEPNLLTTELNPKSLKRNLSCAKALINFANYNSNKYKLKLQLIASISYNYISSDSFGKAAIKNLTELSEFFYFKSVFIFTLRNDDSVRLYKFWDQTKKSNFKDISDNVNFPQPEKYIKQLKNNDLLKLSDTKSIRKFLKSSNLQEFLTSPVKKIILSPVIFQKSLIGFIGIINPKAHSSIIETDSLIKTISEITSSALMQEKYKNRLLDQMEIYKMIFNTTSVAIWDDDITEINNYLDKRRKEEKLFDLKSEFQKKSSLIHDFIHKMKVINVNNATLRLYKAEDKETLMKNIDKIITEKSIEKIKEILIAYFEGKMFYEYETTHKNLEGKEFPVYVKVSFPKSMSKHQRALISVVDLSQQKMQQDKIERKQRLESIGHLAGGIAHDFNNLLTSILGNLNLARTCSKGSPKLQNYLEKAENSSLEAGKIAKQLLTFSRGGTPIKKTDKINPLISNTLKLALSGSKVKSYSDIPDNLWNIDYDFNQLSQAFNNIFMNAEQAMSEGGNIHVKAENTVFKEANIKNVKPGKYVKISVRDNGKGIAQENLRRIFDPYFTTKELDKEKGTGLGLSIAHSIISKHNGYIFVRSSLNKGTTFNILLPASKNDNRVLKAKVEKNQDKKRILLMDDDEAILDVTGQMLDEFGYDVNFAKDGSEAIMMYTESMKNGKPFDLVILDLTIPGGMGAIKTIRELKKINKDLYSIVSTGYSNDDIFRNYRDHGFCEAIEKPYEMDNLYKKIKNILDNKKSAPRK